MRIAGFPGGYFPGYRAIPNGMTGPYKVMPDLLPIPALFLRTVLVLFQDTVDLSSYLRRDNSALTLDLAFRGNDLFFDSQSNLLYPVKILFHCVPGYLEFFRDLPDGAMHLIQLNNAFDLTHSFHPLLPPDPFSAGEVLLGVDHFQSSISAFSGSLLE